MSKSIICFGETVLRLNSPEHRRLEQATELEIICGGAETNVAVLLSRLGHAVELVTTLPQHALGDLALNHIRQHGVSTRHVQRAGLKMGLYFTETSPAVRPGQVLYDRAGSTFSQITPGTFNWNTIFTGASWFHWSGISAAVSASAAEVCDEAIHAALAQGLTISADLNYRSTLWQYGKSPAAVMPDLLHQCHVLVADFDSVHAYYGFRPDGTAAESLQQCWEFLRSQIPGLKVLAMTRRYDQHQSQWYEGLASDGKQVVQTRAYEIRTTVDRIGSGDAFTGGLIHALQGSAALSDALHYATACGLLKHSIPGDFPLMNEQEIQALLREGESTGKIRR